MDGKTLVEKNYCEYAYTFLKHIFSSLKDATALCLTKLPVYLILSESCNIYLINIKCEINPNMILNSGLAKECLLFF